MQRMLKHNLLRTVRLLTRVDDIETNADAIA